MGIILAHRIFLAWAASMRTGKGYHEINGVLDVYRCLYVSQEVLRVGVQVVCWKREWEWVWDLDLD